MAGHRKVIVCPDCGTNVVANRWDGGPVSHQCAKRLFIQKMIPRIARKGTCPGCNRSRRMFAGRIVRHNPKPIYHRVTVRKVWNQQKCWSGGLPLEILPALEVIAALCDDGA